MSWLCQLNSSTERSHSLIVIVRHAFVRSPRFGIKDSVPLHITTIQGCSPISPNRLRRIDQGTSEIGGPAFMRSWFRSTV